MAKDDTTAKVVGNFGAQMGNPMGVTANSNLIGANPQTGKTYVEGGEWAFMGRDPKGNDVLQRVSGADASYWLLPTQQQKTLADAMDATYGKGKWKPSTVESLYKKGLNVSAYLFQNGGKRVDPISATVMMLQQQQAMAKQAGMGGGGAGGVSSSTQTTKSLNLTDPTSARKLVNDSLSQYLGRSATKQEQQAFMKALNAQERMNPTVTQQSSTTTSGGGRSATSSTVMSQGGFNPSAFAEEYARGMEGSGEYQAATGLLNTFISALGEAV